MTIRVVQVVFHADASRRDPEVLLDAWPTMPAVAAAAVRAGVDLTIVHAAHRTETVVRHGVTFHFVDDRRAIPVRILGPVRFRRRPSRIIERVRSLVPQVVHVHDLGYPMAVRQLARALDGIPVLVQDHGVVPPSDWRRWAWRWALRPVAGAAFTAREQAQTFVDAGVLRPDLPVFEVLPASSPFVPGDREAARRVSGIHGDPCLLWTTHLDANKDPMVALDAFEMAASQLPGARLWCSFVRAPLLDDVRRRILASVVLRERVTLLGARPYDHMEPLFQSADFFVQTSRREASGRSLIEAMSCGATPLVTDIPAWRRIVGTAGSLTPVGDARALANAIVDYAGRDAIVLRREARARFEQALTYDVIGKELHAAYKGVADGGWNG